MLEEKSGPSAIVVGAGFGGMAAALRLKAKGWRVTLIDRAPRPGGRAQVFEKDGFRHDAGPTVITAPFLFDELFALFGKDRRDFVTFVPLTPWYRFRFHDGTTFDYGGGVDDTLAEIRRIEPQDVNGYLAMLKHSRLMYEKAFTELADQPFHEPKTMLRQTLSLMRLRANRTVWQFVSAYLTNSNLRQAFSIQPLLLGGNPFDTTSIYTLIHYLERQWGVHFAMGGTGAIVAALQKLMLDEGVKIRLGETVSKILIENRSAKGVSLESGETIAADIVVSDVDPMFLYREMIPTQVQPIMTKIKKRSRLSMGLFVLYFGTRRKYPDVAHHTIWMGARYKELLKDIFTRRSLPEDFSLYLHRPTATDASFAPEGCDSFYVLCPTPNLLAPIDWTEEGPRLQSRIVDALDRTILPGLKGSITADFFMTPRDFENRYLSYAGAGFSIAPYFTQSAWFRFHNRAEGLRNLYLTGAGTHPGAGIPGVLCSAKVVDRLVPDASAFVL
ncbi:phytoene desaturase family protein [Methylocapsa palsarum]|uniref:Phytoene dehydrogenase n=1 Tax=Methylocapsa palsarum TaxID=1612308 RepID=A0A1I4BE28_9HYPH|nr:phytoene desaturase family protein [Methylocapsa palsarum]SFK66550.1 phytoene desaturase [Methylocapsa palsarum]